MATRHAARAEPLEQVRRPDARPAAAGRVLQLAGGRVEIAAGGDAPAVDRDQFRLKRLAARLGEGAQQVPVRGRREGHPLPFALDDQPHGHALHAAGREPRANLPPQQRGNVVAVQAIDDPADFLGPDQVVVDLAGVLQGVADRLFGDFVEHQPMDRHLRLQHLAEVPTDGLSLAVFVRRQIEVLGVLQQVLELADLLALLAGNDVDRLEVVVDVDAQVGPVLLLVLLGDFLGPLRQVADVADAGLDGVAAAEELADRPGLGGRLDDHQRRSAGVLFVVPPLGGSDFAAGPGVVGFLAM